MLQGIIMLLQLESFDDQTGAGTVTVWRGVWM